MRISIYLIDLGLFYFIWKNLLLSYANQTIFSAKIIRRPVSVDGNEIQTKLVEMIRK